jgi:hypothetical protein
MITITIVVLALIGPDSFLVVVERTKKNSISGRLSRINPQRGDEKRVS